MLKTILCIDDERTGLMIRKMLLESKGYSVLTAESGAEGLTLLQSSSVDAVILDYDMPRMNGAEVARAIHRNYPNVPIIMLTGFPGDVPEDALRLVNAFITKGGDPEQLFGFLENALQGRNGARVTILNVDDNEQHRYAVTRRLKSAGFDVIEAVTGHEALQLAHSRPSLIILDINLPDMLGFDVCRRLKQHQVTCDIPVVHISATYPAEELASESLDSGAVRFLQYPDDISQLMNVIRDELQIHRDM